MSEATRIAALRGSLEMRTLSDTAETILARAGQFNDWLVKASGEDPAPPATGNAGIPIPGSADDGKDRGEASA